MKKLSVEEAQNLEPVDHGRTSKVIATVSTLVVGEGLIITREDWPSKNPPYQAIDRLAKKTGRTFKRGKNPNGQGWAVKRLS